MSSRDVVITPDMYPSHLKNEPIWSQRYSGNSLKTYCQKCQRMFYLVYQTEIQQLPQDTAPYELGTSIHDINEEYLRSLVEIPTERELDQRIRAIYGKYFNYSLKSTKRAQKIMNNFIRYEIGRLREDLDDYIPQFIEKPFKTDKWTGFRDVQFKKRIVDWKTNAKADKNDLGHVLQASIYYHSAIWEGYDEIKHVDFVFLSVGKTFRMKILPEEDLIKIVKEIEEKKKKGGFMKQEGSQCFYCGFRLGCQFENSGIYLL